MCGIAGIVGEENKELITQMIKEVRHRGPDDMGVFLDKNISLGHARLSIIDLSQKGRQPMSNENGNLWITFNGEIYNFREIRNELEKKGYAFKSGTDTEVIIYAYEEYGEECVSKLTGMFAFAIWDADKKKLFAARDRFGIKPFYYYCGDNLLVFGSEIKSILLHPRIKKEVNKEAIPYFMGYEYVPAPHTLFRGIKKLLPGHTLTHQDNNILIKKYWDINFTEELTNEKEICEKLYQEIESAVERHLISDVPLGVFLSGGIDSSTIVSIVSKKIGKQLNTFSLGYNLGNDGGYSELDYAQQVADFFGTNHKEIIMGSPTIEDFRDIIRYLDEPMTDFATVPSYFLYKESRKKVKVCLSGEGGDELFAGYDRFLASKYDKYYTKIPVCFRKKIITPIVTNLKDRPEKKGIVNIAKRIVCGSDMDKKGRHIRWQYFVNSNMSENLYSDELKNTESYLDAFKPVQKFYDGCGKCTQLSKEQYIDLKLTMADSVLVKVDRMSMANSLEVRVPFLDHKLAEFSARIHSKLKLKGRTTKYILKKTMANKLQKNILSRPKQGYSFPIKLWLRNELKSDMYSLINDSEIISQNFNKHFINKLIEQHLNKKQNHSHILWALMNLELWHSQFFNQ